MEKKDCIYKRMAVGLMKYERLSRDEAPVYNCSLGQFDTTHDKNKVLRKCNSCSLFKERQEVLV